MEMEVGKESVSALAPRAVVGAQRTLVDHEEFVLAALAAGHPVEVRERRRRQRKRRKGEFARHPGSWCTGRSVTKESRRGVRRGSGPLTGRDYAEGASWRRFDTAFRKLGNSTRRR